MKTGALAGKAYFGAKSQANKSLTGAQFVSRDDKGNVVNKTDVFSASDQKRMLDKAANQDDYADVISKNVLAGVSERFNGLKQSKGYAFVLAKGEKGPELVKVRKSDGAEVAKIELDSNKPMYEIDGITDNVYYVTGKNIEIYK